MKTRHPLLTDTMTRVEVMILQVLFTTFTRLVASNRELSEKKRELELLLPKNIDQLGLRDTWHFLVKKLSAKLRKTPSS